MREITRPAIRHALPKVSGISPRFPHTGRMEQIVRPAVEVRPVAVAGKSKLVSGPTTLPVQPKIAIAAPPRTAPPVYRPQPATPIAQPKAYVPIPRRNGINDYRYPLSNPKAAAPLLSKSRPGTGTAPAVYRPTPIVCQPKQTATIQPAIAGSNHLASAGFAPRSSSTIQPLIVYIGDPAGSISRAYKTEVIKKVFGNDHQIRALLTLKKGELKTIYDQKYSGIGGFFSGLFGKTKDVLIVNGHGSQHTFQGMTAKNLYDLLVDKGLTNVEYSRVVLVACKVGQGTYANFARDFRTAINGSEATTGIDVVAPIGNVSYDLPEVDAPEALGKKLDLGNAKMYVRGDYGGGEERREVTGPQSTGFRLVGVY